jgi:hypothetical protein
LGPSKDMSTPFSTLFSIAVWSASIPNVEAVC